MNEFNGDLLNKLSFNSLSKSSPSTFSIKSTSQTPTTHKTSNLSHVPCKFYKQGTCTAGSNCIFSHNLDPTSESSVCKYFRKGNCKFGTKCALLHTMSPPMYVDPSPFSLLLRGTSKREQDDFMLPSSLNDLLTPSELRKQQLLPHHQRQTSSYEPNASWNAPFYDPSRYLATSAINIPRHHTINTHQRQLSFQPDYLSNNISFEEDGPFIMKDTTSFYI